LFIEAFDNPNVAAETRRNNTVVTIHILDINDNKPIFDIQQEEISVSEGSNETLFSNPTEFYICGATDPDSIQYSTEVNEYYILNILECDRHCFKLN
jgi:hypothetical protein